MQKATRKPGAGPIAPTRHPDDEFGCSWTPGADDRLAHAAEALHHHNDARPLVRVLLALRLLPEAARDEFQLWLDGKRPPYPMLSTLNAYTLAAKRAYRRTPFLLNKQGKRRESAEQKAERVLNTYPLHPGKPGMWRDGGVTADLLLSINRTKGGRASIRIRDYLDAVGLYDHGVIPPDRTKPPKRKAPPRR